MDITIPVWVIRSFLIVVFVASPIGGVSSVVWGIIRSRRKGREMDRNTALVEESE